MEQILKQTPIKNRIPSFDILRVFLLILVVNLHREHLTSSPQLFPNRFGWYAVPLFIILSFYLMSKFFTETPPPFTVALTRVKRFLVPFLFWSMVAFLVHPEAITLRNIGFQLFTGGVVNVPLYYLIIMALFTIFFWTLTCFRLSLRIGTMLLLTLLMFYLQYSGINYNFFSHVYPAIMYCYGRIVELLPFAVTGILLGFLVRRKTNAQTFMLVTAAIGGLFFAAQTTIQPPGIDYSGSVFYFGGVFIFMYFLLVRAFRLPEAIEQKITLLGLYSFGVYVSHYLFMELVLNHVPWSKELNTISPLGFLLIFTAFCYAIIISLDKLTRYRFSYLFK